MVKKFSARRSLRYYVHSNLKFYDSNDLMLLDDRHVRFGFVFARFGNLVCLRSNLVFFFLRHKRDFFFKDAIFQVPGTCTRVPVLA